MKPRCPSCHLARGRSDHPFLQLAFSLPKTESHKLTLPQHSRTLAGKIPCSHSTRYMEKL
jgi:hypothetical protein